MKVLKINPQRKVLCDDCGKDYSNSYLIGGLLFQSKAICPDCAPKWEADAKKYEEEYLIKARCPSNKAFSDWVREDLR